MKKTRHSEERIAFALKQAEGDVGGGGDPPDGDLGADPGLRRGRPFYRWKKVCGRLGVGELRRLKLLEEENRKLKQLVADLSLDIVQITN